MKNGNNQQNALLLTSQRFHASGSVCPQKHLWEFGSLSPA